MTETSKRYSPRMAATLLLEGKTLNRYELPLSLNLLVMNLEEMRDNADKVIRQIKKAIREEGG